jgi:hypothetical protein
MRVAPITGDLLVKLALGALAVGAIVYGFRRLADSMPQLQLPQWPQLPTTWPDLGGMYPGGIPGPIGVINAVADVVASSIETAAVATSQAMSDGVNQAVSSAAGRETNLGGEVFDFFNPDPVNSWRPPSRGGATGSW